MFGHTKRNKLRKVRNDVRFWMNLNEAGRKWEPWLESHWKKYTIDRTSVPRYIAVLLNGSLCLLFEPVWIGSEYLREHVASERTNARTHAHTHTRTHYFYRVSCGKEVPMMMRYRRSRQRRWNKNCRGWKKVKRKRKGFRRPVVNALEKTERKKERRKVKAHPHAATQKLSKCKIDGAMPRLADAIYRRMSASASSRDSPPIFFFFFYNSIEIALKLYALLERGVA